MTDGFAADTFRATLDRMLVPTLIYLAGVVLLTTVGLWAANHPAALPWLFFVLSISHRPGCSHQGSRDDCRFSIGPPPAAHDLAGRQLRCDAVARSYGIAVGLAILLLPVSTPSVPVSWPVLVLGIGLFLPLVRFPLATLAVEWNRHR